MAESDYREVTVEEPTTYFDLADVEGSDLDGWRLAAYNGVTNSRYDLDAGAVVRIPKGTVPVVADPPAIDADEAGRRYEKTRAAAEATVAGAADALAGIDASGPQGNEDAIALVVDGGQEPAKEAKADAAPVDAPPADAPPADAPPVDAPPADAPPADAPPADAPPADAPAKSTPIFDAIGQPIAPASTDQSEPK